MIMLYLIDIFSMDVNALDIGCVDDIYHKRNKYLRIHTSKRTYNGLIINMNNILLQKL
jgi:hypothetical protein